MKQILLLLLFPCLCLAQYTGNANQKITLGEQTTADGLVFRGVENDTALITPRSDTSAYIILDTVNNKFYNYNRTTNVWSLAGGGVSVSSFSAGTTGLTPSTATTGPVTLGGTLAVANGGTNTSTLTANKVMVGNGTSGVITPTNLHWDNANSRLGINTSAPASRLHINSSGTSVNTNLTNEIFDLQMNSNSSSGGGIRLIMSNDNSGVFNSLQAIKTRGTNQTPALLQNNDIVFAFLSNAYDGTSFGGGTAAMQFTADADVTLGVAPQRISFVTSETNNVNRTERLTIKPNGNVGIGTASPTFKLDVNGTARLGALTGTSATFSGIINANSAATAANGSINIDNSDPTLRFRRAGGTVNSSIYEFRAIAVGGVNDVMQLRLWNDAQTVATTLMTVSSTGAATFSSNVGIGTATPTAVLHLKAGTATANTAPLKFTSGVNLTNPVAGNMEFNGTNLFFSPSTTRHTVNHGLTGSATLDFPSTLTLLSADLTITVTGAALSDVVSLGVPNAAVNANTSYSAWVSAANTVTVRFNNYSSGTVNPASGSFKVFVTK